MACAYCRRTGHNSSTCPDPSDRLDAVPSIASLQRQFITYRTMSTGEQRILEATVVVHAQREDVYDACNEREARLIRNIRRAPDRVGLSLRNYSDSTASSNGPGTCTCNACGALRVIQRSIAGEQL